MSKYLNLTALVAGAALLAGQVGAQTILSAETTEPGGSAYLAPSHLVEVAAARGIAQIQLVDGQTLTNSIQNVAEGKTDLAVSPVILPFLMSRGVGPYGGLGAEKGAELAGNIRALYPYALGIFFMYAYDSEGLTGWDDLEGKNVMNGPPRGAALNNARAIIQLVTGMEDGKQYTGVQANWPQVATTIVDGTADAVVLPELLPSGRLVEASAAGKMMAFSIPKDVFEGDSFGKYAAAPGNFAFSMPVAKVSAALGEDFTVISEDDTFRGMTTVGAEMVHVSMDEELAYQLTKAHLETLDELAAKAPFASTAGFGDPTQITCGPSPLKYHKGAVRAWEEAGHSIPDCLKD